jgi:hypothetical protein
MSIQDEFSVRKMCIVLGVRERGYYQWQATEENQKQRRRQEEHFRHAIFNAFIEKNIRSNKNQTIPQRRKRN